MQDATGQKRPVHSVQTKVATVAETDVTDRFAGNDMASVASNEARIDSLSNILSPISTDLMAVELMMIENLPKEIQSLNLAGQYIISVGGKRVRPACSLLVARALRATEMSRAHSLGAILEMVHTASLIHDDLVDEAETRRGLPTINTKFGLATSVLLGDFLYGRAMATLGKDRDTATVEVIASVVDRMAEGEMIQLSNRGKLDTTEQGYLDVVMRKTASLLAASAELGAIVGGATDEQRIQVREYGSRLGCAFQMIDDALDYAGDEAALGKTISSDLQEGIVTLPLIIALREAETSEREVVEEVFRKADKTPKDLLYVSNFIKSHGGISGTINAANNHVDLAKNCLSCLDESEAKSALLDLADFVVSRNR